MAKARLLKLKDAVMRLIPGGVRITDGTIHQIEQLFDEVLYEFFSEDDKDAK